MIKINALLGSMRAWLGDGAADITWVDARDPICTNRLRVGPIEADADNSLC